MFGHRLAQNEPQVNRDWAISAETPRQFYFRGWRTQIYLLVGAVGFVLLISCANIANLLLGRALTRQKEIAIRSSLGASRLRVVRQLLTESVLLALAGGILGIVFALAGVRIFVAFTPQWFPRAQEIGIDGRVLGFTFLLSVLTGILFGLAPALQVSKPNLNGVLKDAKCRPGGPSRQFGRNLLVISEIALTLVLLVGAGLLANSLRLGRVNPGFNTGNLLAPDIRLLGEKYVEELDNDMKRVKPPVDAFYLQLLERLRTAPGVRSVTLASSNVQCTFRIVGRPEPPAGEQRGVLFAEVSSDFVHAIQVPLLTGRTLTARDDEHSPWVALVNDAMVRRYFSGENPVGKVLSVTFGDLSGKNVTEDRPRDCGSDRRYPALRSESGAASRHLCARSSAQLDFPRWDISKSPL